MYINYRNAQGKLSWILQSQAFYWQSIYAATPFNLLPVNCLCHLMFKHQYIDIFKGRMNGRNALLAHQVMTSTSRLLDFSSQIIFYTYFTCNIHIWYTYFWQRCVRFSKNGFFNSAQFNSTHFYLLKKKQFLITKLKKKESQTIWIF